MADSPKLVPLVHDKEKTYYVDVKESIAKAEEELKKPEVKAIELRAVGQEISKVSMIAIRLEELVKCRIVRMLTENEIEKDAEGHEKRHLVLRMIIEKLP